MNKDSLENFQEKGFPWGTQYAKRENFESGYLYAESLLIDKYFKNKSNQRVLIIGSGNGREARPISHYEFQIVCIDIGIMYLIAGRALFASEKIGNIDFIQADMMHLPFAENIFDFVFFSLYSPAGKDRLKVLNNIRRILSTDGLVLLCTIAPLYKELHPYDDFYNWVFISSKEQLSREVNLCDFVLIDSAVDPFRPEYRFSILGT